MAAMRVFGRALRSMFVIAASALLVAFLSLAGWSSATAAPGGSPDANPVAVPQQAATTAPPPVTNPNTDETVVATFANGLTFNDCVGQAVQLPGCGTAPTQAGDRGGWLQTTVFAVMTGGMVLIAWRITRAVRKRDHVLNG
jgi:hypothetical protein